MTPQLTIGDCAGGHRLENRGKNRDVMVVPREKYFILFCFLEILIRIKTMKQTLTELT